MDQSNATSPATEVIVIDATRSLDWLDLRELWRYRDLVWIFAIRDITVRYRQTVVGIAWTLLQPLALMFALGLFTRMISTETVEGAIPPQIRTLTGLLLYQLFAGIITVSTNCLLDNRQMLTKVYFPRMALPLAASMRPLIDFVVGITLLGVMMVWFGVTPSPQIVLAPLVVLLTILSALGFGLWLSALNAHYRDFSHIVPFSLQLGLIISPIASDSARVPAAWRWLYFANPMAAFLDAFRWSVLGLSFPAWDEVALSLLVSSFILITGVWYFRRVDRFLADSI